MDKACINGNRETKRAWNAGLGQFLLHSEIGLDKPELYRDDGVHLSEKGLDVFLQDLQQGLQEGFGLLVKART